MDISLSEEQQDLADTVREMCRSGCTPDELRHAEHTSGVFPERLWKSFRESGLVGLGLPSAYGGADSSMVDLCAVTQELGRAAAPLTTIISTVLCGGMLVRAGSEAQKQAWLSKIATGEVLASIAWVEVNGGYGPEDVRLSASSQGERVHLTGTKILVPFGEEASVFLVPARVGAGPDDVEVFLVPAGPGITIAPLRTMSGELLSRMTFDVEIPQSARIGDLGTSWAMLQETMLRVAVALAGYSAGGARKVLELATEYAKVREQFGRPIGSYQGISHRLADALVAVEGANALAYEAAWSLDQGRDTRVLAAMAKQRCAAVFRDTSLTAHQVFGGIGVTVDMDLQLYSRRAKQLQLTWWDDRYLTRFLAGLLLDEAGPGPLSAMIDR